MTNSTPYQHQLEQKEIWRKRYWALKLAASDSEKIKIAENILMSQLIKEKKILESMTPDEVETPVKVKTKKTVGVNRAAKAGLVTA